MINRITKESDYRYKGLTFRTKHLQCVNRSEIIEPSDKSIGDGMADKLVGRIRINCGLYPIYVHILL
jgi:hypothetical protein